VVRRRTLKKAGVENVGGHCKDGNREVENAG